MNQVPKPDFTVRKTGDNFGLYFKGSLVESGIFATRKTAERMKQLAEYERRELLRKKGFRKQMNQDKWLEPWPRLSQTGKWARSLSPHAPFSTIWDTGIGRPSPTRVTLFPIMTVDGTEDYVCFAANDVHNYLMDAMILINEKVI